MDRVFEAEEAAAFEMWLETGQGESWRRSSTALLDRILDHRPGWRVLDVGCGLGVHLAHLMERGVLATGLEAGPVTAKIAAGRLGSKATIDVGDAHDLPYEDNTFDAVVLANTLELTDRRAQVMAEAARVAVSRVCIIALNPFTPGYWLARRPGSGHPLAVGRPLGLWSLFRLVRDVLGPVPQRWASATAWPGAWVSRWPLGGLVGLSAAVTPRFMTRPLTISVPTAGPGRAPRPAASHGRVSSLYRVK